MTVLLQTDKVDAEKKSLAEIRKQLQLVLLDFGLAEELTPRVRKHFISFLHMISAGNGRRAAYHMLLFSTNQASLSSSGRKAKQSKKKQRKGKESKGKERNENKRKEKERKGKERKGKEKILKLLASSHEKPDIILSCATVIITLCSILSTVVQQ